MQSRIKSIHIAKSSCYPPYGIVVQMTDGRELWDCNCAAATESEALAAARREWPRRKVLMWDHPKHYSKMSRG